MNDTIALHYQPIVECSGNLVGFEALMRWHHRQRGTISPEAFIPIFEANGMIVALSRWALRQACSDAASWKGRLVVSVNLSPVQFEQEDLVGLVTAVLSETGLPPGQLELDTTDKPLLANPERALSALGLLARMGVRIALDDFGTGRFEPNRLAAFPFSKIKIDTSFVLNIETSASARWIIKTIIEFGHAQNLTVAAEGVETAAQLSFLRELGCDIVQGYLFGRPAPIESFADLTERGTVPWPNAPDHGSIINFPVFQQEAAH